jgi:hypothetical protein
MAGIVADLATKLSGNLLSGYLIVFGIEALMLFIAAIMLYRIESDGTRSDVISKMFATEVTDGLLGSFSFNENGDPQDASGAVVGFTIYVATDKLETVKALSPDPEVVAAAGAA